MKILMITHFVPYPPTSGALQRNYNLLREIAKVHEVYLVTLTQKALLPDEKALEDAVKHVSTLCKSVSVFDIPSDKNALSWYTLLMMNVFSIFPYSTSRFYSRKMEREIRNVLKNNSIDLIHVDTIDLARYTEKITEIPVVLNHHNVESELLFRRAVHEKNLFAKLYVNIQAKKLQRYEQRMIPMFNANIAVSSRDEETIKSMNKSGYTALVPNGTDTVFFSPSKAEQECSIIFAGGLNWLPNADAMIHFCKDILPKVREKVPGVIMNIIGTNPPKELIKLSENDSSIKIWGFVSDIREYMAKAAVHVVPLRIGGGTRLKILDALAMGKAIVSTSIGAEGLDLVDGKDILLADTDEIFAQKVIALLNNKELRMSLSNNGRANVEKKYAWNVIGPLLLDVYSNIVKR
jgi:sugar transferase (PEP-CTERM/EpsH1 system associated)